jgi:KUP system potassium uptake protein
MTTQQKHYGLWLAALGVVFGDIGTSPIYALRECFFGSNRMAPEPDNVLGVLSLITWALILVVSIKYLLFVLRADNHGEGGVIALVALLNPWKAKPGSARNLLMLLGLFGGALLYGDGTITPAISVLSAVEGMEVAIPAFKPYVIPITLLIIVGLFSIQLYGTQGIGTLFGPVIAVWFVVLAVLGVLGITQHPEALMGLNPLYGWALLTHHGLAGFLVLGTVFLAVTGCEALYADMGHFGATPIQRIWFFLVFPALLLNYFGQGALLLSQPMGSITDPFYQLAPSWTIFPLIALASMATVIASQAVISGAFSLTRQLIMLRQLPRMNIIQTSADQKGQIYIPAVNWLLMLATLGLVVGFKSSSALAAAYGIAVAATMVITTVLAFNVAQRYDWNTRRVAVFALFMLVLDLTFVGANLFKIADGGWYPIGTAALIFLIITTWSKGRRLLLMHLEKAGMSVAAFTQRLRQSPPLRTPGTGIFLMGAEVIPPYLRQHLERNRALPQNVVLLTVLSEEVPFVAAEEQLRCASLLPGMSRVYVRHGYMQHPDIPAALDYGRAHLGLPLADDDTTYYLGRETLIPTVEVPGMMLWREKLFAFLAHNAMRPTAFFKLPPKDVIELGFQLKI